jgi:hypothetical protein
MYTIEKTKKKREKIYTNEEMINNIIATQIRLLYPLLFQNLTKRMDTYYTKWIVIKLYDLYNINKFKLKNGIITNSENAENTENTENTENLHINFDTGDQNACYSDEDDFFYSQQSTPTFPTEVNLCIPITENSEEKSDQQTQKQINKEILIQIDEEGTIFNYERTEHYSSCLYEHDTLEHFIVILYFQNNFNDLKIPTTCHINEFLTRIVKYTFLKYYPQEKIYPKIKQDIDDRNVLFKLNLDSQTLEQLYNISYLAYDLICKHSKLFPEIDKQILEYLLYNVLKYKYHNSDSITLKSENMPSINYEGELAIIYQKLESAISDLKQFCPSIF